MKLDKQKTVIVHKAACHHGKTESLKKLARLLKNDNDKPIRIDHNDEVWVIQYSGFNIAIITYGDPSCESRLEEDLRDLSKYSIDIYIGASRTKGDLYDMWNFFAKAIHSNFIITSPTYIADLEDPKANADKDYSKIHELTANYLKQVVDLVISEKQKKQDC